MPTPMQTLATIDELNSALAGTSQRPAVFFKHSPYCGTSAMAEEALAELPEVGPHLDADWYLVPVQASRAVSAELSKRFGIRHESPQVLVVDDNRVVWHGSHFRVTPAAIQSALDALKSRA